MEACAWCTGISTQSRAAQYAFVAGAQRRVLGPSLRRGVRPSWPADRASRSPLSGAGSRRPLGTRRDAGAAEVTLLPITVTGHMLRLAAAVPMIGTSRGSQPL